VKAEEGETWLAAPTMKVAKGAAVAWPDGLVMTNFHSKTLNRDFDKVVFVQGLSAGK
jgi:hypothetical protein